MTHEAATGSHKGRLRSWLTVIVILAGFITGGIALTLGPMWTLFGIGAGMVIVGGAAAYASGIMKDTVIYEQPPGPPSGDQPGVRDSPSRD